MGFSFTNEFTEGQVSDKVTRCRCALHSTPEKDVWVETNWVKRNPGTPAQVYDVTATAVADECQSHLGQTDTRTISKNAFDNANDNVKWDFFVPEDQQ